MTGIRKLQVLLASSLVSFACSARGLSDVPGFDTGSDTGAPQAVTTGLDGGDASWTTDDGRETAPAETGAGETGDPPMLCVGTPGPLGVGEPCTAHTQCASGLCLIHTEAPFDEDAVCGQTPAKCRTRATGTLFDLVTRQPVAGETVRAVGALEGITNPGGATPLMQATSGLDGRIDVTSESELAAAITVLAISGGSTTFLTATELVAPIRGVYPPGVDTHDLWVVSAITLAQWSETLAGDPGIPADRLPLGDRGGIVGLVRQAATGDPVAGAVVESTAGSSGAIVRYLGDAGDFNQAGTGSSGIFVVVGAPTTGETFAASVNGQPFGEARIANSVNHVVFSLVFHE